MRQVGSKAQRLPVVAGSHRGRKLRRVGRNSLQLKWSLAAQQNTYERCAQQHAEPVGQRFDDSDNVRSAVKRMSHIGQNLGATVLFAGNLA